MKLDTFFQNFELLSELPNGIQKIREIILQSAIQGRLVPQDPNDEPASVLLARIKGEKNNQIKKTKSNKIKKIPLIEIDEVPINLPMGWVCTRIGEIAELIRGVSYKKQESSDTALDGYLPILRANNINGNINFEKLIFIPKSNINEQQFVRAYDILIAMSSGSKNLVGKAAQIRTDFNGGFGAFCGLIRLSPLIYQRYIGYFFQSPYYRQKVTGFGKGIGINNLQKQHIENIILFLPPLEEQKRIVTKVDQLMALCDQLEARQQKKHEQRMLLNNAALDKLLTAPTPGEFAQHWQRICDNFDLLYDAPETVRQLRQAILQLAVQGKLVAQDDGDEPAAMLLEKIRVEKEQLIKEKRIKKTKPLPSIKENDLSFMLPERWEWIHLGDALLKLTDGTHHSPPNGQIGEFKYVTAKNIKSEGIDLNNITYVSDALHTEIFSRCDPEPGDILYIKDGATTGIVTINDLQEPFSMLSSVALLKNPSEIYNRYLLYVLRSPYFYSLMREDMSGVAITRVTLTKLNRALIPLAPLEEQKRIVAKVDQLMALCDELEAKLAQAQTDGGRLMEAVVHQLNGDS
jgi:type I restriction enzyme S subunit